MTRKISLAVALIAAVGLTLAAGPWSADWTTGITLDPNGTFLSGLESIVDLGYTTEPVIWTSYSEFQLAVGFLWQAFGVTGRLGAFEIQGDLLYGPSTTDFLYGQWIVRMQLGGVDLGFYCAQLSGAVLGGPADGFALRFAGRLGTLDIVSIAEMGARIEDEDFDGIDIVHAATGFYRPYTTDPVVPGQGFTGEKLTLSGPSLGCVGEIGTTLYADQEGFDFVSFELERIDLGVSWLTVDVDLTHELQTKSVALTPQVVLGSGILCFEPYFGIDQGTYPWEIDGITLGGLALVYTWNGVTVKDLTVLDTGRYVITTPEYGTAIEPLADAINRGHDYYADTWELLSIELIGDACCGGEYRMLVNTTFEEGSSGVFGGGMTYAEGSVGLSADIVLTGSMTVSVAGLDSLGMGIVLHW